MIIIHLLAKFQSFPLQTVVLHTCTLGETILLYQIVNYVGLNQISDEIQPGFLSTYLVFMSNQAKTYQPRGRLSSSAIRTNRRTLKLFITLFQMSKQICPVRDITMASKRYTIEAMIVEKGMPRTTSKIAKPYQRILLQEAEGTKIQGTIFGEDIAILSNTLKMFQTISNATVNRLDVQHRFVDHPFQLKISARTPIQAKLIDGLTIRTVKFNFTPVADTGIIEDVDNKIDMLFEIHVVGPRKPAGNSMIVDLRIIDQGLVPTNVTLWDQFSDTEVTAISNLPGPFPIVIAYRLKLAAKSGI